MLNKLSLKDKKRFDIFGDKIFINNEEKSLNEIQYPISSWSSLSYFISSLFLLETNYIVANLATFSIAIISFCWWANQNTFAQLFDLCLITFLFSWPTLQNYNISQQYQFIYLILIIVSSILKFNIIFRYKSLYTLVIVFSLYSLLINKMFISILIFLISALCKFSGSKYGTGLFHILSSFSIITISISFKNLQK